MDINNLQVKTVAEIGTLHRDDEIGVNHFEKLPLEILTEILSYFKYSAEIKTLRLVCKQWFEAVESDHGLGFAKRNVLAYSKIDATADFEHTFRSFFKFRVIKDSDKECFKKTKDIVSSLDLTHLDLDNFEADEILEIMELAKNTLESLSVVLCPSDTNDPTGKKVEFKRLKTIQLAKMNDSRPIPIPQDLVNISKNLESLDITIDTADDMQALKTLATNSQPTLKKLRIFFCFYYLGSNDDLEFLTNLENLKSIEIVFRDHDKCNCEWLFNNLQSSIEHIELARVHIPEEILKSLHNTLPNLKTLELRDVQNDFVTLFQTPISQLLSTFTTNYHRDFTNIKHISQNVNLTTLTVQLRAAFSIETLSILVQKFPSVKTLHISNADDQKRNIFEVLGVISKWKKLRSLGMNGDNWKFKIVGDKIVFHELAFLNLYSLRNLNIIFEQMSFPKLSKLTVDYCKWDQGKGNKLDTSSLTQIESLKWAQLDLPMPRLTHALEKLRVFNVSISTEDTFKFFGKIATKSFTGKLNLREEGEFEENEILEKWNTTVRNISEHLNVSFTKKKFLWENTYAEGHFDLRSDLITLDVIFRLYEGGS